MTQEQWPKEVPALPGVETDKTKTLGQISRAAKMQRAAYLIAKGKTQVEVARQIGISDRTLYVWRQREDFRHMTWICIQQEIERSDMRGVDSVAKAVDTLREILDDPEAKHADRIAAARALIQGAQAYSEKHRLEKQITELESMLYGVMKKETEDPPLDEHDDIESAHDTEPWE